MASSSGDVRRESGNGAVFERFTDDPGFEVHIADRGGFRTAESSIDPALFGGMSGQNLRT